MRKVAWPKWPEVRRFSIVVLVTVVLYTASSAGQSGTALCRIMHPPAAVALRISDCLAQAWKAGVVTDRVAMAVDSVSPYAVHTASMPKRGNRRSRRSSTRSRSACSRICWPITWSKSRRAIGA